MHAPSSRSGRTATSLADFLWAFVDNRPVQNAFAADAAVPAETAASRKMSAAFKMRGFRFCGPTICYALMQSAGLVNDHVATCFRHRDLKTAPV